MFPRRAAFIMSLVIARLSCCCLPPPSPPAGPITDTPNIPIAVGSVQRETDTVERGSDENSLEPVTDNVSLFAGDALRLTNGGEGLLDFGSGLLLRLFNDTQANLVKAETAAGVPLDVEMYLTEGGFTGQLTAAGGRATFNTPGGATITVLGTDFLVAYDAISGLTLVGNFHGTVEVSGGGTTIALASSSLVTVPFGGPPDPPVALTLALADFEQLARDRLSPVLAAYAALPAVVTEPEYTLTVWHQWGGDQLAAIQSTFDEYTLRHPEVRLDLIQQFDLANAFPAAVAAGEGPDIILAGNDQIGPLAQQGLIVPLDDFGVTLDELKATYVSAAIQGVSWQGLVWGLPATQEGIALVYNRALVGPDYVPTDPLNFEDLLVKSKQFTGDTDLPLVCNPGFGVADAYHVAPIFFGFGVPAYVDEQGNAYLDTDQAYAAGQWLATYREYAARENGPDICQKAFTSGQVGMWWTGPWSIPAIEGSGLTYGIAPMGRPFVGLQTLLLSRTSVERGHQDIAVDVMRYFTSAEVQTRLAVANRTIPTAWAALEDPQVSEISVVTGFAQALSLGVPMANTPYATAQWGPVGDAAAAIWNGNGSPAELLKAAQELLLRAIREMG